MHPKKISRIPVLLKMPSEKNRKKPSLDYVA